MSTASEHGSSPIGQEADVGPLPAVVEFTHAATRSWRVQNYMFLEAQEKGLPTLKCVYFAAYRGEWVSRGSFDTIEEAMNAATAFASTASTAGR